MKEKSEQSFPNRDLALAIVLGGLATIWKKKRG